MDSHSRLKSSGVGQSKIYKHHLAFTGVKGLNQTNEEVKVSKLSTVELRVHG